jgi:hypothetical protein
MHSMNKIGCLMVKNTSTLLRDKNEDKTIKRISKNDASRKKKKNTDKKSRPCSRTYRQKVSHKMISPPGYRLQIVFLCRLQHLPGPLPVLPSTAIDYS